MTGECCHTLFYVKKKSAKRILVPVKINGANMEMEFDMGAAVSLVSRESERINGCACTYEYWRNQ